MRARLAAAVVVMLAGERAAEAQNYRELPIGGRTATMGGAGTAAGNDSAMPYLNPAGLAGVPGDIFAVSATVYSHTRRSFDDFFFPSGVPARLALERDRESFSSSSIGELPSSVMYFRDLSDAKAPVQHRLGVSLVIPSARNVELVASFNGRLRALGGTLVQTSGITAQSRTYYIGPSYAVGLGPNLRIGFSLYGRYHRETNATVRTGTADGGGGAFSSVSSVEDTEVDESLSLAPIAGVQLRVVSDLWAGLGVAIPSLSLGGASEFNRSRTVTDTRGADGALAGTQETTTGNVPFSSVAPLRLNAGIAWDRRSSFSAAFDVHLYLPRVIAETEGFTSTEARRGGDVTRRFRSRVSRRIDADAIVDLSLGAEYAFTKVLAVRGGAFTDVSPAPEPTTSNDDRGRMTIDRFGGSLGLGVKLGSFDTTLGMIVSRGTGRYGAFDNQSQTRDTSTVAIPTTETTTMFVLSGAVTVEEAKRKIRDALPVAVPLPDLDLGTSAAPAPWIPDPLPAEPKPPPPTLRHRVVPTMIEPPPPRGARP